MEEEKTRLIMNSSEIASTYLRTPKWIISDYLGENIQVVFQGYSECKCQKYLCFGMRVRHVCSSSFPSSELTFFFFLFLWFCILVCLGGKLGYLKILSLLLQYSTLTKILPVICVYIQKYSKIIRKHKEVVVENGNKNPVLKMCSQHRFLEQN